MEKKVKKKFNKKYIAFVVMGIFALMVVSATIVNYLSNTAEITVQVDSPMSVAFSNGNGWQENLVLADTTGLSTVPFYMNVKNLANNEIIAPNLVVTFSSTAGATCDDLTSIKFTDTWCHGELSTDCPEQEIYGIVDCNDDSGDAVFTIPTEKYKVGQDTEYPVVITFANVEPSTYTIEGTMYIGTL